MPQFLNKLQNLAPYQRNRIIVGFVLLIILILIILSLFGVFSKERVELEIPEPITLVFWNVFQDKKPFERLILDYQIKNPNVNIVYEEKNYESYREFVAALLSAKDGPDVYSIHHTWLPLEQSRLISMNDALGDINPPLIINKFSEIVRFDFVDEPSVLEQGEPQIYALPLAIDTLALYYNIDYFNTHSIVSAPRTWEEFVDVVRQIRRIDESGNITLAGAALGSAFNEQVNRVTDILSLLMMQSGAQMNDEFVGVSFDRGVRGDDGQTYYPAREAMAFYTSFSNPESENYTWPAEGRNSINAFAEGYAAMMLNYSYHRDTIRQLNPDLRFAVAEMPQPAGSNIKINYASYWGYAVPKLSDNPDVAWDFINFLTQDENAIVYLEESDRPTALKALIPVQQNSPSLGVFANQVLTARSWRQPDFFEVQKILEQTINRVIVGERSIADAIRDAVNQINLINFEGLFN